MKAINEKQDLKKLSSIDDGIKLCKILYKVLGSVGIYPALTGGLLYKDGSRKDIDIVLYRNRQSLDGFETSDLIGILSLAGLTVTNTYGFVTKCEWDGFEVDIFNPETNEGEDYGETE